MAGNTPPVVKGPSPLEVTKDTTEVVETVPDELDPSTTGPAPETEGKRVRAIPYMNSTKIIVRKEDFTNGGVEDNERAEWNYDIDHFTLPVKDGKNNTLSQAGADYLTSKFPTDYEYIGG